LTDQDARTKPLNWDWVKWKVWYASSPLEIYWHPLGGHATTVKNHWLRASEDGTQSH